jgi:hypothetical protein
MAARRPATDPLKGCYYIALAAGEFRITSVGYIVRRGPEGFYLVDQFSWGETHDTIMILVPVFKMDGWLFFDTIEEFNRLRRNLDDNTIIIPRRRIRRR